MRLFRIGSVGNLAGMTRIRHVTGIFLLMLTAIANTTRAAEHTEAVWHPVEEIKAAAEHYVKLTSGPSDGRLVPTAGHLDPRLRLPLCSEALAPFVRPGTELSGRTIVGVRCPGEKPWKIYLPVHIAIMERVLVSRESLPRGHFIQKDDVEFAVRDVSSLSDGYLTKSDDIVGHSLKRSVAKGVVLTSSLLQADTIIRRGQLVTLTVQHKSVDIRMTGKALMDGAANQRIRVENLESGRIVEGFIRSAERVEVLVH